jgi:hypothetical protein
MSNRKEFICLMKKYKSISLEEIEVLWKKEEFEGYLGAKGIEIANVLTGFGATIVPCSLCDSAKNDCDVCFWRTSTGNACMSGKNRRTYIDIAGAKTPEELIKAFRERAFLMRKVVKMFEEIEDESESKN